MDIKMGKKTEPVEKIEVVRFLNGSYAIRKDVEDEDSYEYLDLNNLEDWWGSISSINKYCKRHKWGVIRAYKKYLLRLRDDKDAGTPIEGKEY